MVKYVGEELEKRIVWLREVFDLRKPEMAYLFGFLQADGHLGKLKGNKGKLTIGISFRDKDILEKIKDIVPVNSSVIYRTQDTNFKKNYKLAVWTCCDQAARTVLNEFGLPYGKKSEIVKPPCVPFSKIDYLRGFFDGDGSLGFKSNGVPFVSVVTSSTEIVQEFESFWFQITGKHKIFNRNTRDNVYNLMMTAEDAQNIVKTMYYANCISLKRKQNIVKQISKWIRPTTFQNRGHEMKRWDNKQDDFILNHSIKQSVKRLKRTERSVKVRLSRLRAQGYNVTQFPKRIFKKR